MYMQLCSPWHATREYPQLLEVTEKGSDFYETVIREQEIAVLQYVF